MADETTPIEIAFAKALRNRRKLIGISQEELAHRAGVSMRYISMLERNINQPTLSKLDNLARGLNLTLGQFICLVEDENTE